MEAIDRVCADAGDDVALAAWPWDMAGTSFKPPIGGLKFSLLRSPPFAIFATPQAQSVARKENPAQAGAGRGVVQ
jgi:hypothetical protein